MPRGGGIAPFWGSANLPEKVSRNMGYRSDSIAVSRDMEPLSLLQKGYFQEIIGRCPSTVLRVALGRALI